MPTKRMRVVIGFNGSGNTNIFKALLNDEEIPLGVYVNADNIEKLLMKTKSLSFSDYKLTVNDKQFKDFFNHVGFHL